MSVKAKIIIDEKEINVLYYDYGFKQNTDISGRPFAKPVFVGLQLVIETRKDIELADWAFAANQTKQLELYIYPVIMGGKTRKIYFYDCHLLQWDNHFSSTGNQPMTETLHISAAGVKDSNSRAEYSTYWRTTFRQQDIEKVTVEEGNNQEPHIIEFLITDSDGNVKPKYKIDEYIYLRVKSINKIGDSIDIQLKEKTKDFEYLGERLDNDTLTGYTIKSNQDTIKLKVIKPLKQ